MTPLEWQRQACRQVGVAGANTVMALRVPLACNGGTFRLTVGFGPWTVPLDHNARADQIQTALEALPNVGLGGANVTGVPGGPWEIEWTGALESTNVMASWVDSDSSALTFPAGLGGVITLEVMKVGAQSRLATRAAQSWMFFEAPSGMGQMPDAERFLRVKRDLCKYELGDAVQLVDGKDGDAESKDSQRFRQLQILLNGIEAELTQLADDATSGARLQTHVGAIRKTTPNGLPFGRLI